jgi:hypothetical protein
MGSGGWLFFIIRRDTQDLHDRTLSPPHPDFRPDDPQHSAFFLGAFDQRRLALEQLHFGFRVFANRLF